MARTYRSVVTGACGFIGSHVVEKLAQDGHEIVATDTEAALGATGSVQRMNADLVRRLAARVVPADITAPGAMDDVVAGADFVFHVASIFSYSAPWSQLYRVNVSGTNHLIDSIARTAKGLRRLVVWGAGGVYGLPTGDNTPFTESTPPSPTNDYLRSKWFQEFLVMDRCPGLGIKYTILRPTTVFGKRQTYGVPLMIKQAKDGPVVAVPASFTGRVPFVAVEDVAGAAVHLAKYASGENGVFNVNDDSLMSTVDVMRFLAGVFGRPFVAIPGVGADMMRGVLKAAAGVDGAVSKALKKAPTLEAPMMEYMGRDFTYSNRKLKEAGYELKFPDPKPKLIEMANWLAENRLI